jgi:hypothetical protein
MAPPPAAALATVALVTGVLVTVAQVTVVQVTVVLVTVVLVTRWESDGGEARETAWTTSFPEL